MRKILEIRAAEGGSDAQIFVGQLANAYERLARNQGWTCT
jgi:protein subunit release factor A